jgi:hypothetical protein
MQQMFPAANLPRAAYAAGLLAAWARKCLPGIGISAN